jgi:hypothetical protein
MNAQAVPQPALKPFVFCSEASEELCRRILKEHLLPYEPYNVQIQGICKVLDHIDLFAILATGTGNLVEPAGVDVHGFLSIAIAIPKLRLIPPFLHYHARKYSFGTFTFMHLRASLDSPSWQARILNR